MLITVLNRKYRLGWKHEQFVVEKAKEFGKAIPALTQAQQYKAARALCTGKYTGVTTCVISTMKEGDVEPVVVATGEAHCSKKDNYQRERGRRISLGRAAQNLVSDLVSTGEIKVFEKEHGVDDEFKLAAVTVGSILRQYAERPRNKAREKAKPEVPVKAA